MVVVRWNLVERIEHHIIMIVVPLLMITGLPLFMPEYFGWVATAFTSMDVVRIVHRLAGAVLICTAIFFLLYHTVGLRKRTNIFPRGRDFKDLGGLMKYYLGVSKERPKLGFHDPAAKLFEFWTGCVIAMTLEMVGGIILAYPTLFPATELRLWALLLKDIGFLLLVAIGVLHIYFTVLHREYKPALEAMMTDGKVPAEWAKEHHPLWYEEVSKEHKAS